MREFTNMTVVPGNRWVDLDGEGYVCGDGFPAIIPNMSGSVREVPGDRIMAIHWHGDHKHGTIEGFGAGEGFTDRKQIESYLAPWLKARAAKLRDNVDALKRHQAQQRAEVANHELVLPALVEQVGNFEAELASADEARKPVVAGHLELAKQHHKQVNDLMSELRTKIVTDEAIAAAGAAAGQAEEEAS